MARPATLPALLEATAARNPRGAALPGHDWAGVAAAVRRIAGGLAAAGIGKGDRVALFLPNRSEFLLLLLALARRGACAVLLNTRFRAAELAPLLARARPKAIAVARDFSLVDAAALLEGVPAEARASLRFVIGADGLGPDRVAGLEVLPLAGLDGAEAADASAPEAECLTFTTSGTTSGPKLVLHRQRSIATHAQDVAARIGTAAPGAAFLAAVPLCGTFGLAAAMAALAGGAAIHPMERFDAAEADALIRRAGVTHLVGGDDLLLMLADAAGGRAYAPFAFTGFANFHGQAERVMAESARLNLAARGVYGSSEAQALFALQDPAGPHAAIGGGVPASAEAAFRVASDGELLLRGPSLFDRYLGDEAATQRAWTADGWFRSGDLASVQGDPDGSHAGVPPSPNPLPPVGGEGFAGAGGERFRAVGGDGGGFDFRTRAGDALRLGGFLVAPEEIEAFLDDQPGVMAAQVVAQDGQAVAFVIPGAGYDEAALRAACRAELAHFKVPRRFVTLAEFPTTDGPNGRKIQRSRLREMAGE
ncbi:AMP-binding protein [Roseomonas sp. AR75]|uniref:AMP-binding protein n=1 Tax=Roseomonas sp. AR75 TaxID=2562311 RepID=UPI0014851767|nr:AMP-binding protein [Roseomonas sp. AR75]